MPGSESPVDDCMALVQITMQQGDRPLLWVDLSGRILEMNPRAVEALGINVGVQTDRYLWQFFSGVTENDWQSQAAAAGPQATSLQWRLTASTDSRAEVSLQRARCRNRDYFCVVIDQEPADVVATRVLRQIWELQEFQSRHTALRIHDRIIQPLAATLMAIEGTLADLPNNSGTHAAQAVEILRDTLRHSRSLMTEIWSPGLDDEEIAPALQHLVYYYITHHDVELEFAYDVPMPAVSVHLRTALYRIAQEALTNLVRHSAARRGRVELASESGLVRLVIEDWGSGFEPENLNGPTPGLDSIRARIELFGGTSTLATTPGNGTRIEVEVPLENELGQLLF